MQSLLGSSSPADDDSIIFCLDLDNDPILNNSFDPSSQSFTVQCNDSIESSLLGSSSPADDDSIIFSLDLDNDPIVNNSFDPSDILTFHTTVQGAIPHFVNNPSLNQEGYPFFFSGMTGFGDVQVPTIFPNHHLITLQRPCYILPNHLSPQTGQEAAMAHTSCGRFVLSCASHFMTTGCPPCCCQQAVEATSPRSKRCRRPKNPIITGKDSVKKTDKDILFGRGRAILDHPGNKEYLQLIKSNSDEYKRLQRDGDKKEFSQSIVKSFQKMGGRFLKQVEIGGVPCFYQVSDNEARLKVSQALRDDGKTCREVVGQDSPHCQCEVSSLSDVDPRRISICKGSM